jgi:hypothetical protein
VIAMKLRRSGITVRILCTFFGLGAALAFAQDRPLDNIASRQYQHEVRPLRLALDRWLHELGGKLTCQTVTLGS